MKDPVLPLPPSRPVRKDALQNRAHILDIARRAFLDEGVAVSMDTLARLAAVGPGTLYRHFPNKDAVLAALLDAHHAALEQDRATIVAEETDAGHALDRWIDALGDWMLVYDGLSETLRAAWARANSPLTPTCRHVIDMTDAFLSAAQVDGRARPELTGQTLFLGALSIAWASGTTSADEDTRNALRNLLKCGWTA